MTDPELGYLIFSILIGWALGVLCVYEVVRDRGELK